MGNLIFNTTKEYPDMIRIYIYKTPYYQPSSSDRALSQSRPRKHRAPTEYGTERSIRRTKTVISDLILANNFDMFCTFTFSKLKVNRDNPDSCRRVMSTWLHRQRLTSPDLKYIIVPEHHKSGQLHFHALLSGYTGKLKPAINPKNKQPIKTKSGNAIYNLPGYRSGFSTVAKIDDNSGAVSSYVKKYITKEMPLIAKRKRYWTSGNLNRPTKTQNGYNSLTFPDFFKGKIFSEHHGHFFHPGQKIYENDSFEMYEMPVLPGTVGAPLASVIKPPQRVLTM